MTILNSIQFEMNNNFVLSENEQDILFEYATTEFNENDKDINFDASCWVDETICEIL